jgi:hypothetical protein
MNAFLLCLALAPSSAEDWTPLPAPSVCRAGLEVFVPPVLSSGSHLELARADAPAALEPATAALPYALFLQMVEDDARARGSRLEVQRFEGGALVRGDKAVVALANALSDQLEAAGRALDIDLAVSMTPTKATSGALQFERRVRSGDTTFFGTRESLSFVAGFSVQVAAQSGQSEPVIGRAFHGRGLHLNACRVDGGARVFVRGFFDTAEIAEVPQFDPDTADLGVLQQPQVVWTQLEFSGVVDSSGTLSVSVNGANGTAGEWTITIQARTRADLASEGAALDASGFVVFDLAFASSTGFLARERPSAQLLGAKKTAANDFRGSAIPPSAIASLVEAARGPAPRGGRPPLYWSDRLLLVPRSDSAAVLEARSLLHGLESARLVESRVEVGFKNLSASLPLCASASSRFVSGSERPLLVEYRLEVAPEIWMPTPVVESVFDGACFEFAAGARAVDVALVTAESGPVTEVKRENAQIGRLQTVARVVRSGGTHVDPGSTGRIELSGTTDGVAQVRCERR